MSNFKKREEIIHGAMHLLKIKKADIDSEKIQFHIGIEKRFHDVQIDIFQNPTGKNVFKVLMYTNICVEKFFYNTF